MATRWLLLAGLTALIALPAQAECGLPNVESAVCASLVGLGPNSYAFQISAHGHTVVGSVDGVPARWVDGVPQSLGPMPPDMSHGGFATVASSDGSRIYGYGWVHPVDEGWDAFAWTPASGVQVLYLPGTAIVTSASEDGRVIGGSLSTGNQAARWNGGVLEFLGSPAMGSGEMVYGLSADGSVAVGIGSFRAMRWDASGPVDLMATWPSSASGAARAISPDGSIAVGYATRPDSAGQDRAVRWDGIVPTFLELGGFARAQALDLSADGRRIVGEGIRGEHLDAVYTAVLWNEDGSLEVLADRLEAEGVDLDGWSLGDLRAVSDDGRTVTGMGTRDGVAEGFVAVLSPTVGMDIRPGSAVNEVTTALRNRVTVAVYGSPSFDVAALDPAAYRFGPGGAPVAVASNPTDLNGDGYADRYLLFAADRTGLVPGDTQACLEASGDVAFQVCGPVAVTLGCGRGFAVALLLPPVLMLRRLRRRD